MKSPCLTCKQVENPHECTRKGCYYWSRWFSSEWAKIRRYALSKGWIKRMLPSEMDDIIE